jgi:putative transposase
MHKGWHSRGYLPHLDAPGELQALTFRLRDAIPKPVIQRWRQEFANESDQSRAGDLRKKIARYEDSGLGECLLKVPRHAEAMESCLFHADGERYRLLEWCVMPNHVHVLIGTIEGIKLGDVVRTWKTYSAKSINESMGRTGPIWEEDYHDRYIRDESHLHSARSYIRLNPVKAGLCSHAKDWPWGSAARTG